VAALIRARNIRIVSHTTTPAHFSRKKMKRNETKIATPREAKMTSLAFLISSMFYA
jgi:hypothetical protein